MADPVRLHLQTFLIHLSLQGVSLELLNTAYGVGYRHFIVQAKGPTDDIVAGVVREWLHSSATDREELFISVKVRVFPTHRGSREFDTKILNECNPGMLF